MSITTCHECGQQLPSRQRTCPHCGAPQPSSIALKLAVLALIAICLAGTAYSIAHNRRTAFTIGSNVPLDPALSSQNQMQAMAELYVKRALQAPATAKFAPPSEWQTTIIDESTSRMHAWVDSENSSGTTLRAHFTVAIRLNKSTASLLYLQFDDDEKPMFGVRPLTTEEKKLKLEKE